MTAATLLVNGIDRTPVSEWSAAWEERTDAVPQATAIVQDRNNDPTLEYGRTRDRFQLGLGAFPLFDGEITGSTLELPVGMPWRRWPITATGWRTMWDLRLVGVPDGQQWYSLDGGLTYFANDPNAYCAGSDSQTIRDLYGHYTGGGPAFDTTTYVFTYIPAPGLFDPVTNQPRVTWTNNTVAGAIAEIAGYAPFPVFDWLDPANAHHHVAFPESGTGAGSGGAAGGPLTLLFPEGNSAATPSAPAVISDVPGGGAIGGRGLRFIYDATFMPEQCYIVGVTPFIYNGGDPKVQGTGWAGSRATADISKRQLMVDAQSITQADRDAVGQAFSRYGTRARIRGSVTIGGNLAEVVDGWRCGQLLQIIDARLPDSLNGGLYPIHRVAGSLIAGRNDTRYYTLEFGDGPMPRFSAKFRSTTQKIVTPRQPAYRHKVTWDATRIDPGTTHVVTSQMVDPSDKPVRGAGIPVTWSLTVTDQFGPIAEGSISPTSAITTPDGTTQSLVTIGPTGGTWYDAEALTPYQATS